MAAAPAVMAAAAVVGAGATVYQARQSSDASKRSLLMQKEAFGAEQARQNKQEMMAANKKAKQLQELSDEARNARKGGKRSLISAGNVSQPQTLGVQGGY